VQANADVYLVLGHARFSVGRKLDALAAYERAIALDRARAGDAQIRSNATKILDGNDAAASIVALDLLATESIRPPAMDHRASIDRKSSPTLASRVRGSRNNSGIDAGIDRIESWSMDLRQSPSCDERRTAVIKLRRDRRSPRAPGTSQSAHPISVHRS